MYININMYIYIYICAYQGSEPSNTIPITCFLRRGRGHMPNHSYALPGRTDGHCCSKYSKYRMPNLGPNCWWLYYICDMFLIYIYHILYLVFYVYIYLYLCMYVYIYIRENEQGYSQPFPLGLEMEVFFFTSPAWQGMGMDQNSNSRWSQRARSDDENCRVSPRGRSLTTDICEVCWNVSSFGQKTGLEGRYGGYSGFDPQ